MFLGYLDSPSLSSELQDMSSVESVEIELVPDFDEPLDNNNSSPTDVFSEQHDYSLFLLNQEIDTPPDNVNHQDSYACEKLGEDGTFLIHATNLSHILALPICAHYLSASQDNQAKTFNSLASPCPPDSREYVLKNSVAEPGEQEFPMKWFKFIYPKSKPRMTETSICTTVHVAYSLLASLKIQWTINLHGGYPLFMP